MKIKILGISGSPREEGTAFAVKKALEAARGFSSDIETEYISLRGKIVNPCTHCDMCLNEEWKKKTGRLCPFKDFMDVLYEKLKEYDAFIFGSPSYEGAISAQLKAVFDRLRPFFFLEKNPLQDKVFGVIIVGGSRYGGQELAIQQVIHMGIEYGMVPAPVMTFQVYHGGILWSKDRGREGVAEDKEGMESVYAVGRTVARYAKIIKLGLKNLEEKE